MKKIKSNKNKKINILKKSKKAHNKEVIKKAKEVIKRREINLRLLPLERL